VTTVHDLSDGGIALSLAEMAMAGDVGAEITAMPEDLPLHAFLFGEDQARYLIAVDEDVAADILYEAGAIGIPAVTLGLTGGNALILPGQQAISVKQLKAAHETWLPNYMTGKA
jgi:phosphoribosylformylglycinamidine (FGAM) synthase-like enzyme